MIKKSIRVHRVSRYDSDSHVPDLPLIPECRESHLFLSHKHLSMRCDNHSPQVARGLKEHPEAE